MKSILPLILVLALPSCNVTRGSHVVVGTSRPAITPESVRVYLRPPAKFEEVAILNADSRNAFASDQSLADSAMQRMKVEAAKLGANGILLQGVGEKQVGAVGQGFGSATYNNGYAFGTGATVSTPIIAKTASGIAIWTP